MQYSDFLKTVQIIRMLFGYDEAKRFFNKNKKRFDKILDFDYIQTNQSISEP